MSKKRGKKGVGRKTARDHALAWRLQHSDEAVTPDQTGPDADGPVIEQRLMTALLNNPSLIHHHDTIGVLDSRQAVCDHQRSTSA